MVTQPSALIPPGSLKAWILAARPATLWAAVAPVAVGGAVAYSIGGFRVGPAVAALLGAIFIQIGTNFANDVFDFEKGADTEERLGPTRAVQAGLLSPRQMRSGMVLAFGLAFACGLYLVYALGGLAGWPAGWPILLIGVAGIVAGIAYTGGPFPLGYHGLGDLFVILFFGFAAVCGTVYALAARVPEAAWWAAVPMAGLSTAILVVNNLRDRETDAQAGKRTLAVRFGAAGARWEYTLLLAAGYGTPILLFLRDLAPWPVLTPLVTLPLAIELLRRVWRQEGEALNLCLGGTARLLLLYSLLFAAGLAGLGAR
jgi:1,4-dihydroxy-2-naphthoate octaprenyltransferase